MKNLWIYGKNVLISGASSGIGYYVSKILVNRYGCHVYGLGRSEEKLIKAKESILTEQKELLKNAKYKHNGSFEYKVFDVCSLENWKSLKGYLDSQNFKVDILINNAGIMLPFSKFEKQSLEDVERVFKTNFFAYVYSYKIFVKDLKEVKGAIINISSSSALCPVVGAAVYSASKAAIKNFTEAIALEHKKELYISVICPGFTRTELFREGKELTGIIKSFSMKAEKMAKKIVKSIVRKRKRVVLGKDAHLMSGLYRVAPKSTTNMVSGVLKLSHNEMFDLVFENDRKK